MTKECKCPHFILECTHVDGKVIVIDDMDLTNYAKNIWTMNKRYGVSVWENMNLGGVISGKAGSLYVQTICQWLKSGVKLPYRRY